jgi:hypothetical protein
MFWAFLDGSFHRFLYRASLDHIFEHDEFGHVHDLVGLAEWGLCFCCVCSCCMSERASELSDAFVYSLELFAIRKTLLHTYSESMGVAPRVSACRRLCVMNSALGERDMYHSINQAAIRFSAPALMDEQEIVSSSMMLFSSWLGAHTEYHRKLVRFYYYSALHRWSSIACSPVPR